MIVEPARLDADPWLFNCGNGTIDLRDGTLREHRRENLLTRMTFGDVVVHNVGPGAAVDVDLTITFESSNPAEREEERRWLAHVVVPVIKTSFCREGESEAWTPS